MNPDDIGYYSSQDLQSRLPSLNGLRCFAAAAEVESFSRAADQLHLTHGAISRAIRLLEEELEVSLFERRSRRVFLTEAGRKLALAVQEGFGIIHKASRELRRQSNHRPLTVSCEPTLLMRWLIPRLPDFQAAMPHIPVHLVAGGGHVELGRGIDLAIRRNDFAWQAHYHARHLFDEQTGPVCRADRLDQFVSSDGQLKAEALRLHSRTRPDAWATWLRLSASGPLAGPAQTFEHFYFSLQAAAAGIGIAIGPKRLVADEIASGILTAPFGFIADGSSYHLLASEPPATGSPEALFGDWLEQTASDAAISLDRS
jgi:DNA-binding transcriptional LysR family regulator